MLYILNKLKFLSNYLKHMKGLNLLISQAYGEDYPESVVENWERKGIIHDILYSPITPEGLEGYSCFVSLRPQSPMSREEADILIKYNQMKNLGVLVALDFPNESSYQNFKNGDVLIQGLFNAELIGRQFLPQIDLGEHNLLYKRGGFLSSKKETVRRRVTLNGNDFSRTIEVIPQAFLPRTVNKLEINANDEMIILGFRCDQSKVIVKRNISVKGAHSTYLAFNDKLLCTYETLYKADGNFYLDSQHSADLCTYAYKEIIEQYGTAGIIGDVSRGGRSMTLTSFKFFDEAENGWMLAQKCQDFLHDVVAWLGQPARYEIGIRMERPVALVEQQTQPRSVAVGLPEDMLKAKSAAKRLITLSGSMFEPSMLVRRKRERLLSLMDLLELKEEKFYKKLAETEEKVDPHIPENKPMGDNDFDAYRLAIQTPVYEFLDLVSEREESIREMEETLRRNVG